MWMLGLGKTKFARLPEFRYNKDWEGYAGVAKLADALDSKSSGVYPPCGFNSLLRHHKFVSRHSYLVKKRQAFLRNKEGVEAESSASRGRKVSAANDSIN